MLRLFVTLVAAGALLGAPAAAAAPSPAPGFRLGTLSIARLALQTDVIQGTGAPQLARGVGHYRISALPGQRRTVAIAGHRTTYGRPFAQLSRLRRGDRVVLTLWQGRRYVYEVTGGRVVAFNDWSILANKGYDKLVLTTCHPPGSATQRLAVFARLVTSG
jgi:sortase A